MVSPFLSRLPRVSIVFFVAFSVLVRLPVPLVSQLPTHFASASISVFPWLCSTIACYFWVACSLAFFGFLRVREFTCSGPFDPRIHLSLSDVWFAPSGSIRLLIKSATADPFSQRRHSLYWSFGQFPLSCV